MIHTYKIEGMTCKSCEANVTKALNKINGIADAKVDLETKEATIKMDKHLSIKTLQEGLPDKYSISAKDVHMPEPAIEGADEKSKFQQLKPLFIILFYILVASILMHKDDWNISEMMIDFMGLFFIVFSFFKMLDLNGFASTFSMYDPLARLVPFYAKVYPFIETLLGIMLLMRFNIKIALIATIIILGLTTYGVTKTLLSKKKIKCACLGTALDLPMTEATFIENAIMILMSIAMLFTLL